MFENYIERYTLAKKKDLPVHISEIIKENIADYLQYKK